MNRLMIAVATIGLLSVTACDKPAEENAENTAAEEEAAAEEKVAATQPSDEEAAAEEKQAAEKMTAQQAMDELPSIKPQELNALMNSDDATIAVFDANNKATRLEKGVVPGATLLDSSSEYPADILPADKSAKLVFYCANPACMAAPTAAARATNLGYESVSVMHAGIAGWVDAKLSVDEFTPEEAAEEKEAEKVAN